MLLVLLKGVDSVEKARTLVGRTVYIDREMAHLPAGRYFVQDIVGCTVKDADTGAEYGVITAVEHPAASDVYTVQNSAGETFLFPAVPDFLDTLSPEQGVVTVRPIPGMFTNDGGNDDAD